ncbi:MAG TPA: phage holin family protein [Candidatus Limnocylindrales bacterium]|nr:phage holin family protein [Candidatus Limnocylindrales bacterium]
MTGAPRPGADGSTTSGSTAPERLAAVPGAMPPPGRPPTGAGTPSGSPPEAPGLREELGRTRGSALRLVRAHADLAKAELGEIIDNAKRVAAFVGMAIALVLFAAMLASIGSILWLGEWWFGSIGWGVLLGTELFIALAVSLVMIGLGTRTSGQVRAFFVGLVVGVVVAVLLGLNLPNRGWSALADQLQPAVAPEWRILVLAIVVTAIVLGVLGLVAGILSRAGAGGAIGALIVGAVIGALLGALSAITFSPEVAAAIGVAVGLGVWIALAALEARGISFDDLKSRFYPSETIDTTKETIEWVRERTPLGRKS